MPKQWSARVKIVVLDSNDIIDGVARVAGEVVTVPDNYSNVRRVIRDLSTVAMAKQQQYTAITWQKFVDMFKEQYPDFLYVEGKYPELVAAVSVRPTLLQRLMSDPALIMAMLGSADYTAEIIAQYPAVN